MSDQLTLSDRGNYHLYRKETDMRKGFNLLCGIVVNELGRQVMGRDAFIFYKQAQNAFNAAGV